MTSALADTKHVAFVHSYISPDDFSDSMKLVQDFYKLVQKTMNLPHLLLCLCFTRHSRLRMPPVFDKLHVSLDDVARNSINNFVILYLFKQTGTPCAGRFVTWSILTGVPLPHVCRLMIFHTWNTGTNGIRLKRRPLNLIGTLGMCSFQIFML